MTLPLKKAPANFVPAAAVIRGVQALFGITGRKGCVDGILSLLFKTSAQLGKGNRDWNARGWKREVEFSE
jgi:hypothetical protein